MNLDRREEKVAYAVMALQVILLLVVAGLAFWADESGMGVLSIVMAFAVMIWWIWFIDSEENPKKDDVSLNRGEVLAAALKRFGQYFYEGSWATWHLASWSTVMVVSLIAGYYDFLAASDVAGVLFFLALTILAFFFAAYSDAKAEVKAEMGTQPIGI